MGSILLLRVVQASSDSRPFHTCPDRWIPFAAHSLLCCVLMTSLVIVPTMEYVGGGHTLR